MEATRLSTTLARGLYVGACLVASLSCADIGSGSSSSSSGSDKIVNGQDEAGHPYVVSLIDGYGASNCTGTLIKPKVVLTAAHCIQSVHGDHAPVAVEFGSVVGQLGNPRILVSAYLMKEGWARGGGVFDYDNDIALLFLESASNITPISYMTSPHAELVGQQILAVGYGNNNGFVNSGSGVKRSVNLTVREAAAQYFIASWVGDSPQDVCQGDSGGPALVTQGGQTLVAGVVSNGPSYCQGSTQYTSSSANAAWLQEQLLGGEATSQEPSLPAQARYTSCAEVGACFGACKRATPGDRAQINRCKQDCLAESSATAYGHMYELMSCNEGFSCDDDRACLSLHCPEQMRLCGLEVGTPAEAPASDITTCAELLSCQEGCAEDGPCVQGCYERVSSSEVIAQLNNLSSCIGRSGCGDFSCQEEACGAEIEACGLNQSP